MTRDAPIPPVDACAFVLQDGSVCRLPKKGHPNACGSDHPYVAPRRQRIKFTVDWDKLKAPRFTTIRSWRAEKEAFYRSHIGEQFTILSVPHEWSVRGRKIGDAKLLKVERCVPAKLPAELLVEDVRVGGKPHAGWLDRLSKMDDGLLLTFDNLTGLLYPGGRDA